MEKLNNPKRRMSVLSAGLEIKFLKKFISLNLVRNNHCPVHGSKHRTLDVFDYDAPLHGGMFPTKSQT